MIRTLFDTVFRRSAGDTGSTASSAELTTVRPGNIYSFRTSPFFDFAPPETGRFAALKILGLDARQVIVAVLSGVWNRPPTLQEASGASILREQRFPDLPEHRFPPTDRKAVFGVHIECWEPSDLEELVFVGASSLSDEERELAERTRGYAGGARHGGLGIASHASEGEWRWVHDNAAFVADYRKREARNAAERAAREERNRTRLSNLTWEALLAEAPFENWSIPPIEFQQAARKIIHDACRDLSALGPKPRKADVRAVLKRCVEWFNDADDAAGGVIETEEREDICAVLEEMAYVARQKGLADEVDNWRTW